MRRKNDIWTHYPENDAIPEHYSCPFGIVLRLPSGRWEAHTTTACYREVKSPDELDIVESVGEFSIAPHAKSAILRAMAKRPITFPERKAS